MDHETGVQATPARMAAAPAQAARPHPLLRLQARAGNAAVRRLIDGDVVRRTLTIGKAVKSATDVRQEAPLEPFTAQMPYPELLRTVQDLADAAGTDAEVDIHFDTWYDAFTYYNRAGRTPAGPPPATGPAPVPTEAPGKAAAAKRPSKPPPIPPLLHFVWVGRPPSRSAVENVLQWARRAEHGGWKILLWTDLATIDLAAWAPVLEQLRGVVQVREVQTVLDPEFFLQYQLAERAGAFNAASDLARYSILLRHGGVYADMDLAPGGVDLDVVPQLGINDIPFMLPNVRDLDALAAQVPKWDKRMTFEQALHVAAVQGYVTNQLNNNLLITQPGSPFIREVIRRVAARLRDIEDDTDRWADVAALSSGPATIIRALFAELGMEATFYRHFPPDLLENWARVRLLTDESQNLVGSSDDPAKRGSGTAPAKTAPAKVGSAPKAAPAPPPPTPLAVPAPGPAKPGDPPVKRAFRPWP